MDGQIRCPYCQSVETELFSLFGQQLMTVQYYCRACGTPFERVKGDDVLRDVQRHVQRPSGPDDPLEA
jgi:DNA-directed RNA polymerase subunit RPC12/RpoP